MEFQRHKNLSYIHERLQTTNEKPNTLLSVMSDVVRHYVDHWQTDFGYDVWAIARNHEVDKWWWSVRPTGTHIGPAGDAPGVAYDAKNERECIIMEIEMDYANTQGAMPTGRMRLIAWPLFGKRDEV